MLNNTALIIVLYNPRAEDINNVERLSALYNGCIVDNSPKAVFHTEAVGAMSYLWMGGNKGIAAAQNAAFELIKAKGEADYILFLDQDSRIADDYPEKIAMELKRLHGIDPKIALLGPTLINLTNGKEYKSSIHALPIYNEEDYAESREIISSGACILADVFEQVGMNRAEFFIDYVDFELCWRMESMGYKCVLTKRLSVEHKVGNAYVKVGLFHDIISAPQRYYYQYRNMLWLMRMSYVPAQWKINNFIKAIIRLFYLPFIKHGIKSTHNAFRGIKDGLGRCKMLMILALIAMALPSNAFAATDEMPIIAFWGVDENHSTEARFKEFADAGFNVSVSSYGTTERFLTALDNAHKSNVKLMLCSDLLYNRPGSIIMRVKSHPALFGYYISDEPRMTDYDLVARRIRSVRTYDKNHLCYVNLLPDYDQGIRDIIGVKEYTDYLTKFGNLGLEQVSFDFYPVTTGGLRERWYSNLEDIRNQSLKQQVPFWGFVLSTPHIYYPQPTLESLRLQIYSNLAYGAQAIQYFTYWTPKPDATYDYHNGPISNDGKRTSTYKVVQEMNKELKRIAPLFYGSKVTSVRHLGQIPIGCKRMDTPPEGIKMIVSSGGKGVLLSTFEKDGSKYMAIVNRNIDRQVTIDIQYSSQTIRRITKTLSSEAPKNKYTIDRGDILIMKLK